VLSGRFRFGSRLAKILQIFDVKVFCHVKNI